LAVGAGVRHADRQANRLADNWQFQKTKRPKDQKHQKNCQIRTQNSLEMFKYLSGVQIAFALLSQTETNSHKKKTLLDRPTTTTAIITITTTR